MCVYTASLSQVLYDPWDYSRMGSGHTHTHPRPPQKRGGQTAGERRREAEITDQREEGKR